MLLRYAVSVLCCDHKKYAGTFSLYTKGDTEEQKGDMEELKNSSNEQYELLSLVIMWTRRPLPPQQQQQFNHSILLKKRHLPD